MSTDSTWLSLRRNLEEKTVQKNRVFFYDTTIMRDRMLSVVSSDLSTKKGRELFPHPPYSLTEAPTVHHVIRLLKNWFVDKV